MHLASSNLNMGLEPWTSHPFIIDASPLISPVGACSHPLTVATRDLKEGKGETQSNLEALETALKAPTDKDNRIASCMTLINWMLMGDQLL